MATASNSGAGYNLNQQLANIQNSSAYQQWTLAQQKQSSTYIQQAVKAKATRLAKVEWNVTGGGLVYTTNGTEGIYSVYGVDSGFMVDDPLTEEEKQVDRIYRELKKLATGRVKKPPKQLRTFFKQLQSA
jgi:hypothetical protein